MNDEQKTKQELLEEVQGLRSEAKRCFVKADYQGTALPPDFCMHAHTRQLLELFFAQSLEGFFFMMLDHPVDWNDDVDKEEVLDYVFKHQKITKVNDAMLDQYRAQRDDFIGLTPADFFAHDLAEGRRVWRKFFDKGQLNVSTEERRFDSTLMHVDGDYICIYDDQQRIVGHFGVQRDMTERIELETQIRHTQKLEAVGRLAGGIAHEINNVLAVVLGVGSMMESDIAAGDPKLYDIREIVAAARRGKSLVQDLLGYARRGKYSKERLSMHGALNRLVGLLRGTLSKDITVTTRLDAEHTFVEGDPNQIAHALLNLAMNAADAIGREGNIEIATTDVTIERERVTAHGKLSPGPHIEVSIRDDGAGMTSETRDQAFDPFFTTKDVGEGSGLGLPMVLGTVVNHDGTISLESDVDGGTTVTFLLPSFGAGPAAASLTPDSDAELQSRGKVLIVDDERMIRNMGKRLLQASGFGVLTADGGRVALDMVKQHGSDIDLILLDLSMPGMDGVACFAELKKLAPDIPVMICTGHRLNETTDRMTAEGAVGILKKPFDFDELADAVTAAIEK